MSSSSGMMSQERDDSANESEALRPTYEANEDDDDEFTTIDVHGHIASSGSLSSS